MICCLPPLLATATTWKQAAIWSPSMKGKNQPVLNNCVPAAFMEPDSRDFANQDVEMETLADGGSLYFSEENTALISGSAFREIGMAGLLSAEADSGAIASVEPEYVVFASNDDYLRGFARAAQVIAEDLADKDDGGGGNGGGGGEEDGPGGKVLGATWGAWWPPGRMSATSAAVESMSRFWTRDLISAIPTLWAVPSFPPPLSASQFKISMVMAPTARAPLADRKHQRVRRLATESPTNQTFTLAKCYPTVAVAPPLRCWPA